MDDGAKPPNEASTSEELGSSVFVQNIQQGRADELKRENMRTGEKKTGVGKLLVAADDWMLTAAAKTNRRG